MKFTAHATRFERHMDMAIVDLRAFLLENASQCDVSGWSGSSPEEKASALGFEGLFHTVDEVDRFVENLRSWAQ